MDLRGLIEARASETPQAPAILAVGRQPLTYRALSDFIAETAETLNRMRVGRNDRVATVLPNGPEMALAFVSIASAATMAPLNPAYVEREFDFYLSGLGVKALVIQSGMESPARAVARAREIPIVELSPMLEEPAGVFALAAKRAARECTSGFAQPDDIALLLHTSGTTSRPKIVPLTHTNLMTSARNTAHSLQPTPADRGLNLMPPFHIHGIVAGTLAPLVSGGSTVAIPGFYALKFFEWLEAFRPNWYTGVPTMHQAILARAAQNAEVIARNPLRLIRSSSASL